jgi:DNA polymerase III subunit delta
MANAKHCFEILLGESLAGPLPGVIVAFGDDAFLRKETVTTLLARAGIDHEAPRLFDGDECQWIDLHDELATLSLFEADALRIAIVSNADRLVKEARPQLEKWFAHPAENSLLILQVGTFPSNTKLYKLAEKTGWCIACALPTGGGRSKTPSLPELKKWMVAWAKSQHGLQLTTTQATQVLDAVGTDCGLLHQELAKLALYADDKGKLSEEQIRANVGSWRTRTMWEIADAVVDGRVAEALQQLEKVFAAGEHPAAVIPQISWSLRRFGNAAHLLLQAKRTGQSVSVQAAIAQCGFWGADAKLAEGRLRRLGLRRAAKLLDWLLELDLKLKGSHSQTDRAIFALEELCMRFV